MQKPESPTMLEITLYVLIIIGVLSVIIALIWTKIIRKNTFSHISFNYFKTLRGKKEFNNLLKDDVLKKIYIGISINSENLSTQVINDIYVGSNYIYLISNSLSKNIGEVRSVNGKFITISRNKKTNLDINPEIELFISSSKKLGEFFDIRKNLKIIVPASSEKFLVNEVGNIIFLPTKDIVNTIINFELDSNVPFFNEQLLKLEKAIIIKKKRFFSLGKNIYE